MCEDTMSILAVEVLDTLVKTTCVANFKLKRECNVSFTDKSLVCQAHWLPHGKKQSPLTDILGSVSLQLHHWNSQQNQGGEGERAKMTEKKRGLAPPRLPLEVTSWIRLTTIDLNIFFESLSIYVVTENEDRTGRVDDFFCCSPQIK